MDKVILAAFDNPHDIEPTINDLSSLGIDRSKIDIVDQKTSAQLGAPDTDLEVKKNEGMFSGIVRWMHDWGLAGEDTDYFAESVRRGGTLLAIHVPDNANIDDNNISDVLYSHGAIDIDKRAEYYKKSGFSKFDENAQPYSQDEIIAERERFSPGGQFAIPVVEEEVKVGKRQMRRGGVRIVSRVIEEPIEKQVNLREERVDVERRAVDRPVEAGDMAALKNDSIELTETAEEPVVQKEARVKEEVLVRKEEAERTETVRETARRTDVKVDRTDKDRGPNPRT